MTKQFFVKQVAQLWQRDRAKLDTFSSNVQRHAHKSCTKLRFGATIWGNQGQYKHFI